MEVEEDALVSLSAYVRENSLSQLCALLDEDAHRKHQHQWFHHVSAHETDLCWWTDHAQHRSPDEVICTLPHVHVPTCPSLHDLQLPQLQDNGSLENPWGLVSWRMKLAPPSRQVRLREDRVYCDWGLQ